MDTVDKEKRSWIMAQVKSSGNKSTEEKLVKLLKFNKLNGWRRNYKLIGKPDLVYPKERIAIFADGCFWHGCPKDCRMPSTKKNYWIEKIERNKKRDRAITLTLRKKGWSVIRVWEHELKSVVIFRKLDRIRKLLLNRKSE